MKIECIVFHLSVLLLKNVCQWPSTIEQSFSREHMAANFCDACLRKVFDLLMQLIHWVNATSNPSLSAYFALFALMLSQQNRCIHESSALSGEALCHLPHRSILTFVKSNAPFSIFQPLFQPKLAGTRGKSYETYRVKIWVFLKANGYSMGCFVQERLYFFD